MIELQILSIQSVIFTLILIFVTKFIFSNIIKPYRDYLYYKKLLTQNYRTEVNPFTLLGMSNLKKKSLEIAKYNDSHHYAKTQLTNYQVRLLKVGPTILIDLIDPELIKEYYQRQKQGYLIKANTPLLIKGGIIFSEGNDWKKRKRILSHVFNFDFIRSKTKAIAGIVEASFEKIESYEFNKGKEEVAIPDLTSFLQSIFGTVVINNFFGEFQVKEIDGKDLYVFIGELISTFFRQVMSPYVFLMRQLGIDHQKLALRAIDKKVNHLDKRFRQFSAEIVQKIRLQALQQKKAGKDIKIEEKGIIWWIIYNDMLINDASAHSDEKYNITELINQVSTFFLAGTETTGNAITMLIYKLAEKPQILEKLNNEVQEVLGELPLAEVKTEHLKKLIYLDSVVKQVLRMYPSLPNVFVRMATKDHFLGKIPMKKGMQCSVKIMTNHYQPQTYENPLDFNPERWLNADSDSSKPATNFFPFSLGQRNCIGQNLSLLETKLTMIAFVRKYKAVRLQKPNYKLFETGTYGPQRMQVFLTKK